MSTVAERFIDVVSATEVKGTSTAAVVSSAPIIGPEQEEVATTYILTTSALCARQRWQYTEDVAGGASFIQLPSAAVFVADDVLMGPPVDSTAGNDLISLVDGALIARYSDDISSALAARRKIYLLAAEMIGLVVRNADNTFTVLDTPT